MKKVKLREKIEINKHNRGYVIYLLKYDYNKEYDVLDGYNTFDTKNKTIKIRYNNTTYGYTHLPKNWFEEVI